MIECTHQTDKISNACPTWKIHPFQNITWQLTNSPHNHKLLIEKVDCSTCHVNIFNVFCFFISHFYRNIFLFCCCRCCSIVGWVYAFFTLFVRIIGSTFSFLDKFHLFTPCITTFAYFLFIFLVDPAKPTVDIVKMSAHFCT
ncbi:hypothetical protein BDA99DRAFT_495451 [Phascolomyces articulosus]|uniref:Uncharacterized protein n=1 Tax=Phascolomyces articulosus TaxID=60185 RepID=A0AAD5KSQ3_9FUNG|nr:hypothetical protein BDA99DRAFT_495451 [Phascolomyces articulosus]